MNGLFGRLALLFAIAAAVLVGGAGPAFRFGYIELPLLFQAFQWGVYAAAAAAALCLLWIIGALIGRSLNGFSTFVLALILAGGAAYLPISMRMTAQSVPFIHDITTDTATPPPFVALLEARQAAPNGADYNTDPAEQQKGYPDIQPLVTDVPPEEMFKRAEATARAMGWEIAASVPEEGRIEATDTTVWFGFKDDVVIRIAAEGEGSRLDIRSMSPLGKSDLGKNADRIRKFLAAVKEAK
jgi:uncharacterized protein (DUF1499 family)